MKTLRIIVSSVLVAIALVIVPTDVARARWVDGYYKSDGTYVNGYWRSNPNGLKYDNFSFDGDWSDAFNDSYYSSDRSYSSDWYTPSWVTQDDYWVGKSFYDTRSSYSTFDYNDFNYDYDFWNDPIYDYTPSYNYGYDYTDYLDDYSSDYFNYDSLYNSTNYSNNYLNDYTDDYSSFDTYSGYNDYSSSYDWRDYETYDSYSPVYDTYNYYDSYDAYDSCYSYSC